MSLQTAKRTPASRFGGQEINKGVFAEAGLHFDRQVTEPQKEQEPFVYVGGFQDTAGNFNYLRYTGAGHVLACAPTRAGKTVGLTVPSLLSLYFKDSVLLQRTQEPATTVSDSLR